MAQPEGDNDARERRADVRTFLIADVRGYTRFTQEYGDAAASRLAGRFAEVVGRTVPEFDGELIELRGDEALSVFFSARQALQAAAELQRRLRVSLDGEPPFPLGVGMGLDAGEAVPLAEGYRGKALNIAARLCSMAKEGEILATEIVTGLAGRVEGIVYGRSRWARVKGIREPLRVIVVGTEVPLPPLPVVSRKSRLTRKRVAVGVAAGLLAALTAAILVAFAGDHAHAKPQTVVYTKGLVAIDPATNLQTGFVHAGYQDFGYPIVAVGEGFAWMVTDYEVKKISLATQDVLDRITFVDSDWVAAGDGWLWVSENTFNLPGNLLYRVDPETGAITGRFSEGEGDWVAVGEGFVWLCSRGKLWKIAPSGRVLAKIPIRCVGGTDSIVIADHSVWAVTDVVGVIKRINPETTKVEATIDVQNAERISAGLGAIWALSPAETKNTVTEINPATSRPVFSIGISGTPRPDGLAVGFASLWVGQGTRVLRIDPVRGRVTASIEVHGFPKQIVAEGGKIWVSKLVA
jgi:class 3 adenylate cyclase